MLDLQLGFWQILMALDDVKKTLIIKKWTTQFSKVFVDNVNIHNGTWNEHLCHI
jgi:hypothetical protein